MDLYWPWKKEGSFSLGSPRVCEILLTLLFCMHVVNTFDSYLLWSVKVVIL